MYAVAPNASTQATTSGGGESLDGRVDRRDVLVAMTAAAAQQEVRGIGMLSRAAISVPQPMQAERGFEIERRSGTRAATTLTKLPNARAGGNTSRASATFTESLSAAPARWLSTVGPGADSASDVLRGCRYLDRGNFA